MQLVELKFIDSDWMDLVIVAGVWKLKVPWNFDSEIFDVVHDVEIQVLVWVKNKMFSTLAMLNDLFKSGILVDFILLVFIPDIKDNLFQLNWFSLVWKTFKLYQQ